MTTKYIISLAIIIGAAMTICGCQGESCPKARQLADEARLLELEPHLRLELLKAAIDSYRNCIQTNAKSESERFTIDKELQDLTQRFTNLKLAQIGGRPTSTVAQYTEVIYELVQALSYDDPNDSIRESLEQYRAKKQKLAEEIPGLLSKAADKGNALQWQEAISSLDDVLAATSENEEAKQMRRKILSERDAYYKRVIPELCEGNNYNDCKKAELHLDTFKAQMPKPDTRLIADLQRLLEQTRGKVAEQLIGQKKYFTAYMLAKDVNTPKYRDLLDLIVGQGSTFYMALANEEYRNVKDSYAYAAAVKAMKLSGSENDQAFKLHRDCADRVDDSLKMKIGISFESSGDDPDIGKNFSNELLSYLHPLLPYGIGIDERNKIEFGIEKVGSKDVIRLLGLKWAVFGDIQCKVLRERDERQITTWSPVSQTIPNPHYETELKMMMESDDKSSKLPNPQPTISTQVSEKLTYTVGEERLHGQVLCSARIYSPNKEHVISTKNFITTCDANDLFRNEVPGANIAWDPLELPQQLTFEQQMREDMVKQVGDWLLNNFSYRQRSFYEEAEYFIERKQF
ncbi:MAG: hypothetical protein ACXABY_33115, partial [Candidatus Thorarchaeota archaeon]